MRRVLPILFNTEMVRSILDGRKSCTRRTVKGYIPNDAQFGYTAFTPDGTISCRGLFETTGRPGYGEKFFKLPYQPGDILYVRETFAWCPCWDCGLNTEETGCGHEEERIYNDQKGEYGCYIYRALSEDNEYPSVDTWHPSIHMPKKAARIWLKVTNVRVERLQEITLEDIKNEGIYDDYKTYSKEYLENLRSVAYPKAFSRLWNSTIKKTDLDRYGWDTNPWVYVIEFERCEKPEGM